MEVPADKREFERKRGTQIMIGVIGLLLAITCLIVLSYKGVNAFIA